MPITLHRPRPRSGIAWFESEPLAEATAAFEERGFRSVACTNAELRDSSYVAGLNAIIFSQAQHKPRQIVQIIEAHFQRLVQNDCLMIIRPGSAELALDPAIISNSLEQFSIPIRTRDSIPPRPYAYIQQSSDSWAFVANFVAESPIGSAPNAQLRITHNTVVAELDPEYEILLRRAFADCTELHLVQVDEPGRSGGVVYRGFAELTGGVYGQWPQAYFIKLGPRDKILDEFKNYRLEVEPYIPFHLGPHLAPDRCALGSSSGVLVGDYVGEAESLRSCAAAGRASAAIACLFDRTLIGWHRRTESVDASMAQLLTKRFPRSINRGRLRRARELGATRGLSALRALFARCVEQPVLVGPIHGDLHASNVLVRNGDAVLIDFYAHRDMPLLCDAASLEASLMVDACTNDPRLIEEWLSALKPLYSRPLIGEGLAKLTPKDPSHWLSTCIHQIRRYARQWELRPDQYAAALAVALLIKAAKDPSVSGSEASRRAAAYVFAEHILCEAFGRDSESTSGTRE